MAATHQYQTKYGPAFGRSQEEAEKFAEADHMRYLKSREKYAVSANQDIVVAVTSMVESEIAEKKKKGSRTILVDIETEFAMYGRRAAEADAYRGHVVNHAAYAHMPEGIDKIFAKRAAEANAHRT